MRAVSLCLLLAGCSYDWNSVQPSTQRDASADVTSSFDPRHTILPGTSCNPVSADGCNGGNYCLGQIESNGAFSSLTCHSSFGSSAQGQFCASASNCVTGLICWTHPDGSAQRTCEEPCFADADCASGFCLTSGTFAIPFGRVTLFRCL